MYFYSCCCTYAEVQKELYCVGRNWQWIIKLLGFRIWLQNPSNLAVIKSLDQRAARAQVSNFLFIVTFVEAKPALASAMFWMLELGLFGSLSLGAKK